MDGSSASGDGHDHDHTDGAADREMSGTVPAGHDNSDGHHDTKPVSTDEQAILNIMAAIETGWETGDGELFRQNFLDWSGARYFESGGENTGLLDLVENHVEPEKVTIPDLELDFSNIDVQFEGSDFAWAVADTAISGTFSSNGERLELVLPCAAIRRKSKLPLAGQVEKQPASGDDIEYTPQGYYTMTVLLARAWTAGGQNENYPRRTLAVSVPARQLFAVRRLGECDAVQPSHASSMAGSTARI